MSTVQLPTWLVIAFTGLALLAPTAAAFVQGRFVANRDDRRWANERENERTKYWRGERVRAYAALVAALSKWRLALYEMGTAVSTGGEVTSGHIGRVLDAKLDAEDTFGELTLLASDVVEKAVRDAMLNFTVDHDELFANEGLPSSLGLLREIDRVVAVMQKELGIEPLVSPSPPSETTS